MKAFDRVVAALGALVIAGLTFLVADTIATWDIYIIAGLGIFVVLVFALLMRMALSGRHRERYILKATNLGEVRISMLAVENLVRRAVREIKGVREADTFVDSDGEGLEVNLRLFVNPEVSIPGTIDAIEARLEEYIKAVVGVPVSKVVTVVANVAADARARVE